MQDDPERGEYFQHKMILKTTTVGAVQNRMAHGPALAQVFVFPRRTPEKNVLFGVLGWCVVNGRGSRQNDAILVVDSPINQGLTEV